MATFPPKMEVEAEEIGQVVVVVVAAAVVTVEIMEADLAADHAKNDDHLLKIYQIQHRVV